MKRVPAALIASLLLGFLFLSKLPPPVLCHGADGGVAVHFENPTAERCDTGHCGTDPRAARASHPPLVRPSQCLETSGFHHEPAVPGHDLTILPEKGGPRALKGAPFEPLFAMEAATCGSLLGRFLDRDPAPLDPPPKDAFQTNRVLRR